MPKVQSQNTPLLTKKRVVILVVFLLLLYVVVPRVGSFSDSFAVVGHATPGYVLLAGALVLVTFALAAGIYVSLAIKALPYKQTLSVQMASAFTNRLLPAGLGTVTLYIQYLRRSGHSLSQALTVTGANNLMGILGHGLILLLILAVTRDVYPDQLVLPSARTVGLVAGIIVVVVVTNLLVFSRLRAYAYKLTKEVFGYAWRYREHPQRLAAALGLSLLLTTSYVTIFYFCALAVGADVSIAHIFLVFTIGMIAGTATPTPGGLIGAEAGLTGGLIAYNVAPETALAAALLYRFLTYWLPLLPGFIIFARIRKLYS